MSHLGVSQVNPSTISIQLARVDEQVHIQRCKDGILLKIPHVCKLSTSEAIVVLVELRKAIESTLDEEVAEKKKALGW